MRHTKKHESVAHKQGKKAFKRNSEEAQMLDSLHKDFKSAKLNMFK